MLVVSVVAEAGTDLERVLGSAPVAPIKVQGSGEFTWAEYCPDNTCEVIRRRQRLGKKPFSGLALAYFFYFSEYAYLEEWRTPAIKDRVDQTLRAIAGNCTELIDKELARCMLLEANRSGAIQLMYVRYDEGKVLTGRLDFLEKIGPKRR